VLRRHKAKQAVRLFTAEQIRATLDGAVCPGASGPEQVKGADTLGRACILLGINCGFGQADCAELQTSALNLETGWIDFPRPKTGISRRCPLWPETVAAIRSAIAERPKAATSRDVGRVLLSEAGTMLVQRSAKGFTVDLVAARFTGLIRKMGYYKKQIGFYTLRHTFETIAGDAKDQVAVDAIMGHVDHSMAGHYRERIEDARLRAVVDHVRAWLWPKEEAAKVT
jgi:integrase